MSGRNSQGFSQYPSKSKSSVNSSANQYPTYFSNEKYSTQPSTESYSAKPSSERYSWANSSQSRSANPSSQHDAMQSSARAGARQRQGFIILGNSGVGKSFLANIIIDKESFVHKSKPSAVTLETEFEEYNDGSKTYVIFNIPGLVEAKQDRIERNKQEIDKAFNECPNSIVLYVFGVNNGRIRNEDVVAFNALNDAYPFKPESLILVVNGIPARDVRDQHYEGETIVLLRDLLHMKTYKHVIFLDKINTFDVHEKKQLREKMLSAIHSCCPSIHEKEQDIQLDLDKIKDLTSHIADMTRRFDQERLQHQAEFRQAQQKHMAEMDKQRQAFQQLQQDIQKQQREHEAEKERIRRDIERQQERTSQLQEELRQHQQRQHEKYEEERRAAQENHKKEMTDLQKSFQDILKDASDRQDKNLEKILKLQQKQNQAVQQKYEKERQESDQRHKEHLKNQQQRYDNQMKETQQKLDNMGLKLQEIANRPQEGGCLYGDDFVRLQNGHQKPLKDLRSGDKVYSINKQGEIVKDEFIMMLHGGSKEIVQFYTIVTETNQNLSLTGDHLIIKYIPNEKRSVFVAASELQIDDFVLMSEDEYKRLNPVRIKSIELSCKTGFYTPMTYTEMDHLCWMIPSQKNKSLNWLQCQ